MGAVAQAADPSAELEKLLKLFGWLARMRWGVAAGLLAVGVGGGIAGSAFPAWTLVLVAALLALGNIDIHRYFSRRVPDPLRSGRGCRQLVVRQAAIDLIALWILAYLTGGVTSPLAVCFLLPVVFVSVLITPRAAFAFCTALSALLGVTALAEVYGWLPHPSLFFDIVDFVPPHRPIRTLSSVGILAGAAYLIAALVGSGVGGIRLQVEGIDRRGPAEAVTTRRMQGIFSMLEAIGSVRDLRRVLETAAAELALVMQVKGISVKLLSEDGKLLRYAAAFGLPESMVREKVIEVERSPLNKRVIQGEPFVTGQVTALEMFQFGETLSAAHLESVLFVPLNLEGRVIGILGAYCEKPDRFDAEEVNFFRLTASLVAVAVENARAYEAVTAMSSERRWFMMKVAHNLRAPLAGMLSILEVVRDGYLGPVNDRQGEYLRRLDRRARTMLALVNEVMTLSRNRQLPEGECDAATDLAVLARRVRRTFQDKAAEKRLRFQVDLSGDLPDVRGRLETVEQMLENLVSNAIKYTPTEGSVDVRFSRANGTVRIEVSDTGIGIPASARPKLFTEFFRAENAKALEDIGTGLGLAIVKEIADQLGGRIVVESEEGVGTIFVVHLPIAAARAS